MTVLMLRDHLEEITRDLIARCIHKDDLAVVSIEGAMFHDEEEGCEEGFEVHIQYRNRDDLTLGSAVCLCFDASMSDVAHGEANYLQTLEKMLNELKDAWTAKVMIESLDTPADAG